MRHSSSCMLMPHKPELAGLIDRKSVTAKHKVKWKIGMPFSGSCFFRIYMIATTVRWSSYNRLIITEEKQTNWPPNITAARMFNAGGGNKMTMYCQRIHKLAV